jgi:hypothetical protein
MDSFLFAGYYKPYLNSSALRNRPKQFPRALLFKMVHIICNQKSNYSKSQFTVYINARGFGITFGIETSKRFTEYTI